MPDDASALEARPMPDDARLRRLSRELFFAATAPGREVIPPWVIDRMTSLLDEEDVAAGRTVFSAGDPPEFIYFMQGGRIRMDRDGAPPWTFEGRWVLGIFDIVLDRPRARSATALSDVQLMKIKGDSWLDLLEDSFEAARAALENSARTVAALSEALAARGVTLAPPTFPLMPLPEGRLNLVERLALLYEMPHLGGSGVQTLADLAAVAEEHAYEPGESLFKAGARKDRTFMVLEGEVEASRTGPSLVQRFGPGTFVSGAASFGEPAIPWGAEATKRTRTLSFRHDDWFDLLEEHFDMFRSALAMFALERERILEEMAALDGGVVLK